MISAWGSIPYAKDVVNEALLERAYDVRIVNNTTTAKYYLLQHTTEPTVWVNIMRLEPQGIFKTKLITGRYEYRIGNVYDDGDYETEQTDEGYFSVTDADLMGGYMLYLGEYPFDNQGKDWTQ
jgi:hypothetical protein